MTEPDPFRYDDAAYVLGALDESDRLAFEAHLATCAECRARVAEVRPTAARLAGISSAAIGDLPPEPETLLPGLLARARRERARGRLVTAGLGAVAAASVAALAVVAWPSGSSAPASPTLAFAAVRPTPVSATARLVSRAWGTEIDLRCHYSAALTHYVPYELVVTDTEQHTYVAGSWTLARGRDTVFTGGTAVRRSDIQRMQITLADGTPILQLTP
jgi:anti-sigma factor RsiW